MVEFKEKKRIALIGTNRFNPNLCDGVSNSMLEILLFLKKQGNEVCIFNFFTNQSYPKYMFEYFLNASDSKNVVRAGNSCRAVFRGINVYMEILPDGECHMPYQKVLKIIVKKIQQQKIDYVFTAEDCFISLLSVHLLRIQGAHFFHSLPYVKSFLHADNPYFVRFLKKRTVFAISKFIQAKLRELLEVNSVEWNPMIDFSKYSVSENGSKNNRIGFYSGGKHKGDAIVNKIMEKMPKTHFIVVGRLYSHQFRVLPSNLKYLGDITDVRKFYNQIKILLVPSVIGEAFSRVILEAAVNGIPVIANRVGGIPQTLGNSGILINCDLDKELDVDKIVDEYVVEINRLLSSDKEYSIYSRRALLRAKEYEAAQNKINQHIYDKYIR